MYIKTTQKSMRELVKKLASQGLCNEQAMPQQEWLDEREGINYTLIATSHGRYGVIAELYYSSDKNKFYYV